MEKILEMMKNAAAKALEVVQNCILSATKWIVGMTRKVTKKAVKASASKLVDVAEPYLIVALIVSGVIAAISTAILIIGKSKE